MSYLRHMPTWLAQPSLPLVSRTCLLFAGCSGSAGSQASGAQTPQAPQITAQPTDKAVFTGDTATFSVTATGTAPLTYDWRRNGATLGAASSATYTTPPSPAPTAPSETVPCGLSPQGHSAQRNPAGMPFPGFLFDSFGW